MRKIKFRVWSDIKNYWLKSYKDGGLIFGYNFTTDEDMLEFGGLSIHDCLEDKFFTVQQFTGLYDKNGKEIYEGDIVKFTKPKDSYSPVMWNYLTSDLKKIQYGLDGGQYPEAGYVAISLNPADLEDGKMLNHMMQPYMEVVGNIKEILKTLQIYNELCGELSVDL